MRGPMGKPKNRVENPGKLLKRLMDYIFRDYKFHCIIVFILIFVGVIANVQGTMFTRDLIDKYITPFYCPVIHRTLHRLHMQSEKLLAFMESESWQLILTTEL